MGRESEIKRRMMRNFVGIGILMWKHLEEAKKNPRCFSYWFIYILAANLCDAQENY
jgi:hypothetical protein